MKKQNILRNNRGMTLVELLVGITILALIVSPLLHTFFTSANTANKSARLGLATTAAQNIVERMEATHMMGISGLTTRKSDDGSLASLFGAASAQFYEEVTVAGDDGEVLEYKPINSCESGETKYDFVLRGLSYGNANFDALISLDATDFHQSNDVEITQYTPMDAVYAQPYGDDNPDHLAAEHFANEANKLASTSPVRYAEDFKDRLERSIDINFTVDAYPIVKVTAVFSYRNTYRYERIIRNPNGTESFEDASALFTYSRSYEFYRGPITGLSSIYFFFYPNYMMDMGTSYTPVRDTSRHGTAKDNIYINNNPFDLEVSIFLIKQKTPELSSDALNSRETSYAADVIQYHSTNVLFNDPAPATIYSNLNTNVTNPIFSAGTVAYYMYWGNDFRDTGALINKLVDTQAENRFYSLSVKLFDPGTDPFLDSAKPIYAIDASKLD